MQRAQRQQHLGLKALVVEIPEQERRLGVVLPGSGGLSEPLSNESEVRKRIGSALRVPCFAPQLERLAVVAKSRVDLVGLKVESAELVERGRSEYRVAEFPEGALGRQQVSVSVIVQVVSYKVWGKRILLMAPIHHHFELLGWKETKVVVRFWILGIIFALFSLTTLKLR